MDRRYKHLSSEGRGARQRHPWLGHRHHAQRGTSDRMQRKLRPLALSAPIWPWRAERRFRAGVDKITARNARILAVIQAKRKTYQKAKAQF